MRPPQVRAAPAAGTFRIPESPAGTGACQGLEDLTLHLLRYGVNMGMLLFGLDLLSERGLIEFKIYGSMLSAGKPDTKGKADITLSPLYGELEALAGDDENKKE